MSNAVLRSRKNITSPLGLCYEYRFSLIDSCMSWKRFLIVLVAGLMIQGCSRWPQIVIGDSSGILTYNRHTGQLEVLWEKHAKVVNQEADSINADSIPAPKR